MSSRALRRLKGEQRAQAALNTLKLTGEDEEEQTKGDTTAHKQKNISNIFELIGEADVDVSVSDEETAERISDIKPGAASLEKDAVKDEKSNKKKEKKEEKGSC